MIILTRSTFSTRDFSYKDGVFAQEASTLRFNSLRHLAQIYDDAGDVGVALISHKTGVVIRYALLDEIRDREGEILSWEFAPIDEDKRKHRGCRGTRVTIFND